MKKDLKEILNNITPNTSLEEVISYCDTMEDLELLLANLPVTEVNSVHLLDDLKRATFHLIATSKLDAAELTTAYIQRNLKTTYPQAAAILDLLKKQN